MANPYVRPVLALDMVEARSEVRPGGPTNRSIQKHTVVRGRVVYIELIVETVLMPYHI
jgi:hypothetical protein